MGTAVWTGQEALTSLASHSPQSFSLSRCVPYPGWSSSTEPPCLSPALMSWVGRAHTSQACSGLRGNEVPLAPAAPVAHSSSLDQKDYFWHTNVAAAVASPFSTPGFWGGPAGKTTSATSVHFFGYKRYPTSSGGTTAWPWERLDLLRLNWSTRKFSVNCSSGFKAPQKFFSTE